MADPAATLAEEVFDFPKYIGLLHQSKKTSYAMGFVKQLHVSKIVPVRVGPEHLDQTTVYEYNVQDIDACQAVLVRSAWLRPVGSMDGAQPLKIQVLIDGDVILEESIDEHLMVGYGSSPRHACACNKWDKTGDCKCPVKMLSCGEMATGVFPAVVIRGAGEPKGDQIWEAIWESQYGVFAPDKTLIEIRVVKPGRGPVEFQARCGITAALYSTRAGDISA